MMSNQCSLDVFEATTKPETPLATVVNITRVKGKRRVKYDVYIGRKTRIHGDSIFRNQFRIGKDGTRSEVIEKYRQWIMGEAFIDNEQIRRAAILILIPEMKGLILGCWCKPEPCHGDILCDLINGDIEIPFIESEYVEQAFDYYYSVSGTCGMAILPFLPRMGDGA